METQVTFRNVEQAHGPLEELVRAEADKLEQFYDKLMSCRVIVEAPHRHRSTSRPHHVRIDLRLPNDEIVISHGPDVAGGQGYERGSSPRRGHEFHLDTVWLINFDDSTEIAAAKAVIRQVAIQHYGVEDSVHHAPPSG